MGYTIYGFDKGKFKNILVRDRVLSRAGKIRFSGARKSVLLKASSGERCAPQNVVHLVTFRGTRVHLILWKDESVQ